MISLLTGLFCQMLMAKVSFSSAWWNVSEEIKFVFYKRKLSPEIALSVEKEKNKKKTEAFLS